VLLRSVLGPAPRAQTSAPLPVLLHGAPQSMPLALDDQADRRQGLLLPKARAAAMSAVALPWAPQASHPGRTAADDTVLPPLRHHLFALTLTASEVGGESPAGAEACSGAPRTHRGHLDNSGGGEMVLAC
jgi:hypothetical protein